jgi:hypothetical protein
MLEKIRSKIITKISALVLIEIILIISSFALLADFQSQDSTLGSSINIAGKSRYLTSNLLLQAEKYLHGSSTIPQVKAAMNQLEANIMTLKEGGTTSGVNLKPLSPEFMFLWYTCVNKEITLIGSFNLYLVERTSRFIYF